jgi:hypothetical protein
VNFAIKLGYKGKDQKAQDKMKLAQGVDQVDTSEYAVRALYICVVLMP